MAPAHNVTSHNRVLFVAAGGIAAAAAAAMAWKGLAGAAAAPILPPAERLQKLAHAEQLFASKFPNVRGFGLCSCISGLMLAQACRCTSSCSRCSHAEQLFASKFPDVSYMQTLQAAMLASSGSTTNNTKTERTERTETEAERRLWPCCCWHPYHNHCSQNQKNTLLLHFVYAAGAHGDCKGGSRFVAAAACRVRAGGRAQ